MPNMAMVVKMIWLKRILTANVETWFGGGGVVEVGVVLGWSCF